MMTLMKNKLLNILISAVCLIGLLACSGTKNLTKPQIEMPGSLGATSDTLTTIADVEWQEFYTDTLLRRYIRTALEKNYDFLAAAQKVEELAQLYGVDKLNLLPNFRGLVGETYETNDYYDEKFTKDPEISFKITLNWEIDLWGGLTEARRKSAASFRASVDDMRAMQITLISEVAAAYYNLVALKNELNIVRQTLITREQALEKSRLRFTGGLTSELVYQQAKVEYATAAALVPSLQNRIVLRENALNLLMGRLPGTPVPVDNSALDRDPSILMPVGVPSQVLEKRPDIHAAEQRLQVALHNCGVTYSNQFPKLVIGITGGWENDEIKHLFQSPFSYLLGNIAGTIFDFGKNRRKYKSSVAAYEQARLRYEKSVNSAFSEIYGAISTFQEMRKTSQLRLELRNAAEKYVNLAGIQYASGSISYIDVLDAQRRYFDARTSYSNAVRDQYLSMIALYKALGGGWM